MKIYSRSLQLFLTFLLLFTPFVSAKAGYSTGQPDGVLSVSGPVDDTWVYLPILNTPNTNSNPSALQTLRVNAPFVDPRLSDDPERDSAIFWFGKVTPDENYTDVRVHYEADRLIVIVEVFDRLLWNDRSSAPDKNNFPLWDSVTLLLNTDTSPAAAPTSKSFRVDAMVNNSRGDPKFRATYQGNGTSWTPTALDIDTYAGWRGDALNNPNEDRGWLMRFSIYYASLGLENMPQEGSQWKLGVIVNDRDDSSGRAINPGRWPETIQIDNPGSWGELYFGIPKLPASASPQSGTVTIRQGLQNAIVPDAAVGGTVDNLCPGDSHFIWNVWGNSNFAGAESLNIQNQSDVADWPCFAKYYVTFPLDQIPPGKVIQSASLILHHWGNNGPSNLALDSIIHVYSVADDWNEAAITWNNAPMAVENLDRIRIPLVDCTNGTSRWFWPCIPRTWDVGRAVSQAYQNSQPVRLALYSSDSAMHSGKLFTSSDVDDWNATGRPTLVITYGDR